MNKLTRNKGPQKSRVYLTRIKLALFLGLFLLSFSNISIAQTYEIDDYDGQTVNTCTGIFYDSGGAGSFYGNNEDYTVTFCSDNGLSIHIDFTTFEVRVGDTLWIYDGPDTGSTLLGGYSGEGTTFSVTSSGTCLTFNFISNPNFNRQGWAADISCVACVPPVTSPLVPSATDVCAGETINYSVDMHAGSTYNWTVLNGTPVSLVGGTNNLDITWDAPGGISGSIKVVEINACLAKDSSELIVDIHEPPIASFVGLGSDYCIDDAAVTLTGNPAGGVFSGPGITGTQFDPASAGAGTHNIIYTYTDATTGCSDQDIQITTVWNIPAVSFSGLDPQYDSSDPPATLTGIPAGGIFSGPGIAGNVFDPAVAGTGLHEIIYEYSNVGCTNSDTNYTNVIDYDFKAGAYIISDINNWCSLDAEFSTVGATPDELRGSCWNTGPNYNRWFTFQATTNSINVELKIGGDDGSMRYPYVALWDASNNELACARYSSQYSHLTLGSTSLTPGQWYFISVDNYANAAYDGSFTLCVNDQVSYDYKDGAIELTDLNNWCSLDAEFTTLDGSADGLRGGCWNTGPNYNKWFKFQATTSDILVQMKTGGDEGSLRYGYISIWDELDNELACDRYSSAYSDLVAGATGLTPGNWYYITVDNYSNAAYRGTFALCISDVIDYDYKAGAIELTDLNNWTSPDAAYSTMNASPDELKGSCWNTGPNYNRWFRFQATTNDILVQMKTGGDEGSLRYGYIAIWDDANNELACSRYVSAYTDLTASTTSLTPGNWYYVSVDNYSNAAYRGSFTLGITDVIDYDFKEGAIELTDLNNWCSPDAAYTTMDASADELAGSCWNTGPNYNRWFRFQATTTDALVQMKTGGEEGSLRYGYLTIWDDANNELAC
ncbi:MAG: CUB domain-containing protein, partial [Bacteroidota bacterium]|nr:CUB domain-containing protein [Bacteroidota bacterium]